MSSHISAIISEFNPFHNGHRYLCEEAYRRTGCDHLIVLMSGNFTQRALPAVTDKYTRAASAIAGCRSISAVFELPFIYATGSAMDFADGAVRLLNKCGCISSLVFGVESTDYKAFDTVSSILVDESGDYRFLLTKSLAHGRSYPAARQEVIKKLTGRDYSDIMASPNNILALEYISSLRRTNSDIEPILVQRIGAGYSDTSLDSSTPSASGIRSIMYDCDISELYKYMPHKAADIISDFLHPINSDYLAMSVISSLIRAKCRVSSEKQLIRELTQTADISEGIAGRLAGLSSPQSYEELTAAIKTRNVTMTRVQRCLLHLLTGVTDERRSISKTAAPGYLNLLALNKDKTGVISEIRSDDLHIIDKKSAYSDSDILWNMDIAATALYNEIYYLSTGIALRPELTSTVRLV